MSCVFRRAGWCVRTRPARTGPDVCPSPSPATDPSALPAPGPHSDLRYRSHKRQNSFLDTRLSPYEFINHQRAAPEGFVQLMVLWSLRLSPLMCCTSFLLVSHFTTYTNKEGNLLSAPRSAWLARQCVGTCRPLCALKLVRADGYSIKSICLSALLV